MTEDWRRRRPISILWKLTEHRVPTGPYDIFVFRVVRMMEPVVGNTICGAALRQFRHYPNARESKGFAKIHCVRRTQ